LQSNIILNSFQQKILLILLFQIPSSTILNLVWIRNLKVNFYWHLLFNVVTFNLFSRGFYHKCQRIHSKHIQLFLFCLPCHIQDQIQIFHTHLLLQIFLWNRLKLYIYFLRLNLYQLFRIYHQNLKILLSFFLVNLF